MTAKQKAIELVNKMETIVQPWESNQCALIAVDEILNIEAVESASNIKRKWHYMYWQEVKKEIQKTLE